MFARIRRLKIGSERRAGQDKEIKIRAKRNPNKLENLWWYADDFSYCRDKSWKKYRKTQYK